MGDDLQSIYEFVATELTTCQGILSQLLQSDEVLLGQVVAHLQQQPGKQLRPAFVLLTAGICGGITEKSLRGAVLVTLLHQASLVHDDVVDEASQRRSKPSVNATWNNKVAVLFGDYLLAQGLHMVAQYQDYEFLDVVTKTVQAMIKGELLQLEKVGWPGVTEQTYLEIIHKKTASLFEACAAIGALATHAPATQVMAMRKVGQWVGMAFQLKDDVLDYGTEDIGKPLGVDVKEGKLTLPLIYALQQASTQEQQKIWKILKSYRHDAVKRQEVIAFVRNAAAIRHTQIAMEKYRDLALEALQDLPNSVYKRPLSSLVQYVIERRS